MTEARETSIPHQWRDKLGGDWLQNAPRSRRGGESWAVLDRGFVTFLWMLGHKADADGHNRRPPGGEWIGRSTRTSKDSVRRYYEAAQALGVIQIWFSPNGRFVQGYTLLITQTAWLHWDECRAILLDDRRAKSQRKMRADSAVKEAASRVRERIVRPQIESARADSRARIVLVDSARAESNGPTVRIEGTWAGASPHVQSPESGSESARADSREEDISGVESARDARATLHTTEATLHVRGLPGTTRGHHEMAEVVDYGADPRARGRVDSAGQRLSAPVPAPRVVPPELEHIAGLRDRHVAQCPKCSPRGVVNVVQCGVGATLHFEFLEQKQRLQDPTRGRRASTS